MYKLIQKNQKKLLAVFGVLLMVVFIIPPAAKYGSGRANPVVGEMGSTPVYAGEMELAKNEWNWLSRFQSRSIFGQPMPMQAMVFAHALTENNPMAARDFRARMQAEQLGNQIADAIKDHPEMFLLLQKEAEQNGLTVSRDDAEGFVVNQMSALPAGEHAGAVQAVQSLLLVSSEINHLMSAIKISRPAWQHAVARGQEVRLNLIDFRADDFAKQVPAPTPQQLREQFEQYKNVPPGVTSEQDPLGFGYQVPTRVKLQYVEIPHAQVVDAVLHHVAPPGGAAEVAGADPQYAWDVQAAMYYNNHTEEFRNTAPATAPSTQPTTQTAGPATEPASQPAIKPFAEVKAEIIAKLAEPKVQEETARIAKDVTAQLASDWIQIRRANPAATRPSNEPRATQPSDEATSLAVLEKLRSEIQQKDHVAINVHDIAKDWQDEKELAKLPGIGSANTPDGVPFPQYATSFTRPAGEQAVVPLQVWEPSQPMADGQQNAYVFRLTAAQIAHPPADLTPVAKQVEDDWKLAQAYDLAKRAARQALDNAKSSGLSQAARTASQTVVTTPMFSARQVQDIPGYALPSPAATEQMLKATLDLIGQATPADKQPERLVELPAAKRVVVMELGAVQLPIPEWFAQFQVKTEQQQQQFQKIAADWFSYDAVVSRLKYKAQEKS